MPKDHRKDPPKDRHGHKHWTPEECCERVDKHLADVYKWQQDVQNFFWTTGGGGGTPPPPPPKWP